MKRDEISSGRQFCDLMLFNILYSIFIYISILFICCVPVSVFINATPCYQFAYLFVSLISKYVLFNQQWLMSLSLSFLSVTSHVHFSEFSSARPLSKQNTEGLHPDCSKLGQAGMKPFKKIARFMVIELQYDHV